MSKTIAIHSFRGGTGKSNITANLSYALAAAGRRVGVIDTDIQSPGIHVLLGGHPPAGHTLNEFLWGRTAIDTVAQDVSTALGLPPGRLFLIPSSMNMGDIAQVLKQGYSVGRLNQGFQDLVAKLGLDYLLIDTHPGLNEETLLSIAVSDLLLVVMRPDQQDFQGTSVTVEVARRLKTRRVLLVINKVSSAHDPAQVRSQAESAFGCPVAGVLPLSPKLLELGSSDLCLRVAPREPWAEVLHQVVSVLQAG
jgi:MinD-like ATPase involved in chromosome partitioning or flagellar assembly